MPTQDLFLSLLPESLFSLELFNSAKWLLIAGNVWYTLQTVQQTISWLKNLNTLTSSLALRLTWT